MYVHYNQYSTDNMDFLQICIEHVRNIKRKLYAKKHIAVLTHKESLQKCAAVL